MKCPVCHGELQASSSFCPYCGTRLDWTGTGIQPSPPTRHVGIAVGLIALIVLGGLFASGILIPEATRFYDDARNLLRNLTCLSPALCTNSTLPTTSGKATYDQQVSLVFRQDFYSLNFNVTAVQQTDSSGFGPAYLLNGLSDTGVRLSLSFSGGSVVMSNLDYNTGASSSHSYAAGSGSIFKGSSSSRATRTPTSLMTEWYHAGPYETSTKQVTYSEQNVPISSSWVCIGEYTPANPNSAVFGQCSSELLLGSQTQQFSYHGLNAYASQYMFQTGPS